MSRAALLTGCVASAVSMSVVPVPVAASASAAARCHGERATIVGTPGRDRLVGTSGRDVIVGLGGNDDILGLGGDDLICAGRGDDTVFGGAVDSRPGDDVIFGGRGSDRLHSTDDQAAMHGGRGHDRLVESEPAPGGPTGNVQSSANGGRGVDTMRFVGGGWSIVTSTGQAEYGGGPATAPTVTFQGFDNFVVEADRFSASSFRGGPGSQTAEVRSTNVSVRMGAGNDTVKLEVADDGNPSPPTAQIDGGPGRDALQIMNTGAHPHDTSWKIKVGSGSAMSGSSRVRFHSFGRIAAAQGNDVIIGTPGRDKLFGRAGDDLIRGQGGSDHLDGGPGYDTVVGGSGTDVCDHAEVRRSC